MRQYLVLTALLLGLASTAHGQWSKVLKELGLDRETQGLSDDQVISGLKEALTIGAANAVKETGVIDGYFENEVIRILLPDQIQKMEKVLRITGFGPEIDEFTLSMNRAAEKSAPFAKEIFWKAIKEIRFDDARKILTGGDTAATDYLRATTGDDLAEAFRPIVKESLDEVGVTRQYKDLVRGIEGIPFMTAERLDLDQYVLNGALDGLFYVLGEEEKKIRENPAARVTDLLKEVFGKAAGGR